MIERYSLPEMAAIWSERRKLELWQQVEGLALEAWAAEGVAAPAAAKAVLAAEVDVDEWRRREEVTRHDVAAFVDVLGEAAGPEGTQWLHFGLTSSDVLDTALAVQMRDATSLLRDRVAALFDTIKTRAFEHRTTAMVGRTHGVWAEPTTFGAKLAGWAFETARAWHRLTWLQGHVAHGKLSGAVGTYAAAPPAIEAHVCAALGLSVEPAATQVVPRDRHASFLTELGILGSTLERFATEIRHLQRSEVGEATEHFGAGQKGSSAMPHKRNPIASENVTGLSRLLRAYAGAGLENVALWHERDISHSSVERVALPDASLLADYATVRMTRVIADLVVDAERMRRNLESTKGLVHSEAVLSELIANGMGRHDAYGIVQAAARSAVDDGVHLRDALAAGGVPIADDRLDDLFDLDHALHRLEAVFDRLEAVDLGA